MRRVSKQKWRIWVEMPKMPKMWGIRLACKEPRWKLKYSGRNNIDMINDKFKEWTEVEIIENKHICKNLVSKI